MHYSYVQIWLIWSHALFAQVSTHSTLGARERYFDDDDNYNLQTMVTVHLS